MSRTSTDEIVLALTQSIMRRRLVPGTKLAEQQLADHFNVSRTIIRQALHQLSQNHLVTIMHSRGAFVASPSVAEAKQVFESRRYIEVGMMKELTEKITASNINKLQGHIAIEKLSYERNLTNNEGNLLLNEFHMLLAQMNLNDVVVQLLSKLIDRCTLIGYMYESNSDYLRYVSNHEAIVDALSERNIEEVARLTNSNLLMLENSLIIS